MATLERKRQIVSVEKKKKIINAFEADLKKFLTNLIEEFSTDKLILKRATVQMILRDKHKILKAIDDEIVEINERSPIIGPVARQAYLQLCQYFQENSLSENLYSSFDQIEELLIKDQMSKLK